MSTKFDDDRPPDFAAWNREEQELHCHLGAFLVEFGRVQFGIVSTLGKSGETPDKSTWKQAALEYLIKRIRQLPDFQDPVSMDALVRFDELRVFRNALVHGLHVGAIGGGILVMDPKGDPLAPCKRLRADDMLELRRKLEIVNRDLLPAFNASFKRNVAAGNLAIPPEEHSGRS